VALPTPEAFRAARNHYVGHVEGEWVFVFWPLGAPFADLLRAKQGEGGEGVFVVPPGHVPHLPQWPPHSLG
jgi:hypothetical protein